MELKKQYEIKSQKKHLCNLNGQNKINKEYRQNLIRPLFIL
jgi:hypothetical protein